MQNNEYLVTQSSSNLINELRKYAWDKDKRTSSQTNKPIDMFNHAIDGVRYHEMESLGKQQKTAKDFR
jgi:phage terminase large subunit